MSDEPIKQIEKLLDFGIGDPSRLSSMKLALESGRQLHDSDKQYLQEKYMKLQEQLSKEILPTSNEVSLDTEHETVESSDYDYSLTILKNRLAKGEISAGEFDNLKKKLLETDSVEKVRMEIKDMSKKVEEIKEEQTSNQLREYNKKRSSCSYFGYSDSRCGTNVHGQGWKGHRNSYWRNHSSCDWICYIRSRLCLGYHIIHLANNRFIQFMSQIQRASIEEW